MPDDSQESILSDPDANDGALADISSSNLSSGPLSGPTSGPRWMMHEDDLVMFPDEEDEALIADLPDEEEEDDGFFGDEGHAFEIEPDEPVVTPRKPLKISIKPNKQK